MKKDSKRIRNLKTLITKNSYNVDEGINLIKNLGTAKFGN